MRLLLTAMAVLLTSSSAYGGEACEKVAKLVKVGLVPNAIIIAELNKYAETITDADVRCLAEAGAAGTVIDKAKQLVSARAGSGAAPGEPAARQTQVPGGIDQAAQDAKTAERDIYAQYKSLGTIPGWMEFLAEPRAYYRRDAEDSLRSLIKDDASIAFGTMTAVRCSRPRNLTMDGDTIELMAIVGSIDEGVWWCETGTATVRFTNRTTAPLYAVFDVRFGSQGLAKVVGPGQSVSLTSKVECTTSNPKNMQLSRGRALQTCADSYVKLARIVVLNAAELAVASSLATSSNEGELAAFLSSNPTTTLRGDVEARIAEIRKADLVKLSGQLRVVVTPGPTPVRLIDPQTYRLDVSNPTSRALTVRVKTEAGERSIEIPAGGSAQVESAAKPSTAPVYSVDVTAAAPP
jgi:hypothetical protein